MNGDFSAMTAKIIQGCLILLVVGCACFQFLYFAGFIVDDAYISFRYAENFAKGRGIVFNPGEYVEGYTNFLWVVILGGLYKLGFDPQVSARVLGILCSLCTLWLTFKLSRTISFVSRTGVPRSLLTRSLNVSAPLFLACSPAFGLWAGAGLETPFFGCLLMLAVWRHLREESLDSFPFSALFFGISALIRPEGSLYFGLTFLSALIFRLQTRRRMILNLWRNWALFLPFVGGHLFWRWQYYGSLLPNTYYMKIGDDFSLAGVKYSVEFFFRYGGLTFFLTAVVVLLAARFQEYWLRYLLLLFGASVAYFMYVGGDWMPEFRFFVPVLPLYWLCVQEGLRTLSPQLSFRFVWRSFAGVVLLILSLVGSMAYLLYTMPRITTEDDGHVVIGKLLQKEAAPQDVLAAIDIGALAYFSGLRTIDYFGLVDDYLARLSSQEYTFNPGFWGRQTFRLKVDLDYVLAQQPMFIEVNTLNVPQQTEDAQAADPFSALMLRHPGFQAEYRPFYHAGNTTLFKRVPSE